MLRHLLLPDSAAPPSDSERKSILIGVATTGAAARREESDTYFLLPIRQTTLSRDRGCRNRRQQQQRSIGVLFFRSSSLPYGEDRSFSWPHTTTRSSSSGKLMNRRDSSSSLMSVASGDPAQRAAAHSYSSSLQFTELPPEIIHAVTDKLLGGASLLVAGQGSLARPAAVCLSAHNALTTPRTL